MVVNNSLNEKPKNPNIPEEISPELEVAKACGATAIAATVAGETSDEPKSRIATRYGRNYLVTTVTPVSTAVQNEQIIASLKQAMPTSQQKDAIEKYLRPAIERFGI